MIIATSEYYCIDDMCFVYVLFLSSEIVQGPPGVAKSTGPPRRGALLLSYPKGSKQLCVNIVLWRANLSPFSGRKVKRSASLAQYSLY